MELEQKRGISITSAAMQFEYRDYVINLLDTPGHRDFSEDTYRVLAAVDAVVMVLDSAKGIEPQTLKLFEVCRARNLPVLTFLNKFDRPVLRPARAARRDRDADRPAPDAGHVAGRRRRGLPRRDRSPAQACSAASPAPPAAARIAPEEELTFDEAAAEEGTLWQRAMDGCGLLDAVGADVDLPSFLAGTSTPVFAGSALTDFGVRAPARRRGRPRARRRRRGPTSTACRAARRGVLGVRVQGAGQHGQVAPRPPRVRPHLQRPLRARDDDDRRPHRQAVRDQVRVDGVRRRAQHGRRGVPRRRRRPRQRHRSAHRRHAVRGRAGRVPRHPPSFAPELFTNARPRDTSRVKQFRRGLEVLEEEGVVQVLRDPDMGDSSLVLAAVGQLQFEVFAHRLESEFNAPVELTGSPYQAIRGTDAESADGCARSAASASSTAADGCDGRAVREQLPPAAPADRRARADLRSLNVD